MWLKLFTTLYFIVWNNNIVVSKEVGERCSPSDRERDGECVVVNNCKAALRDIKETGNHNFNRCGFSGFNEIVCCPKGSNDPETVPTRVLKTTTTRTTMAAIDKYGENQSNRIADRECRKIIENVIPPLGLHIIGGEEASIGEFPHMVALGYSLGDDNYEFKCGGSLVSVSFVLTAAHCVDTLDQIKPSIARMGVIDITGSSYNPETDERVTKIILHPSYARNTKYHDLALLRLEKHASINMNLAPACLYTQDRDPAGQLTVTGWGKTSNEKDLKSSKLLKANVTVVLSSKCGESYTNWRKLPVGISSEQICAGDPQGLRDTCQGDSGGPLQGLTGNDGYYRIVGITSFGRGCGSPIPGVYTRVSHYLDWIESQVWSN